MSQADRGRLAHAAGGRAPVADVDDAAQERAGGQHRGAAGDPGPVGANHGGEAAVRPDLQVLHRRRAQCQGGRGVQRRPHGAAIQRAVRLRPRPAHRRPLAPVQQLEMDARRVRHPAHQAVERINLTHQMPFADPTDRRIARHFSQRFQLVSQQQRARAHAGGGRGGLTAGMATADNDDVKMIGSGSHERDRGSESMVSRIVRRRMVDMKVAARRGRAAKILSSDPNGFTQTHPCRFSLARVAWSSCPLTERPFFC